MSDWDKERLDQMIADGVEESSGLDYKRAAALQKTDKNRADITKDVSSFANSAGGTLIYGIAEPDDRARRHLPERLAPINRTEISKEWLDQVIQTIQPRVEGVVIHAVTISEHDNTVCYVVEVPESHTAHMAPQSHSYYRRFNFNATPMEDYEVRLVMNRHKHPRIKASVIISFASEPDWMIFVRLENVGQVLARQVMVALEVPFHVGGRNIRIDDAHFIDDREDGERWGIRLWPQPLGAPIFPGSDVRLSCRMREETGTLVHRSGRPVRSAHHLDVTVFADEMPALRGRPDLVAAVRGMAPIEMQRIESPGP